MNLIGFSFDEKQQSQSCECFPVRHDNDLNKTETCQFTDLHKFLATPLGILTTKTVVINLTITFPLSLVFMFELIEHEECFIARCFHIGYS